MKYSQPKRDTLNIRIKPDVRLNRTVFALNPKAYAELMARLDAPLHPNERLRGSMQTPAPWE